jgi:hypothetical protein
MYNRKFNTEELQTNGQKLQQSFLMQQLSLRPVNIAYALLNVCLFKDFYFDNNES